MIEFADEMRGKEEILKEFKASPGMKREDAYRLCLLELVADFRDLGKERKDEVETVAIELLHVKQEIKKIWRDLNLKKSV